MIFMKVLIVTNHPLEKKEGGCIASRTFVNALATIFPDCTLIYPSSGISIDHLLNNNIKKIPCVDRRPKWIKGLGIYFGVLHRFRAVVFEWINLNKPGLVVFDTVIVSQRLIGHVKRLDIKTVTIHHNVEIDYYIDNKMPLLIRFPHMFYLREAEKKAVLKSDLSLTLTEKDRIRLNKLYSPHKEVNIRCLGIFEPMDFNKNDISFITKPKKTDTINIVVTGSLAYPQNNLSILEFFKTYYPALLNFKQKFIFTIAGSNPSEELKILSYNNPDIKLIPDPDDILNIVSGADIYLCPINRGSGIKLRIMDSLKLGIPTLVHEVSASGYEIFIKSGFILQYNSVDTFKEALDKISSSHYDKIAIKELFKECFSFESGVRRLENIMRENL